MGVFGLDYSAVYQVAETLQLEMTPALLEKIQALEAHMLLAANKQLEGGIDSGNRNPNTHIGAG